MADTPDPELGHDSADAEPTAADFARLKDRTTGPVADRYLSLIDEAMDAQVADPFGGVTDGR